MFDALERRTLFSNISIYKAPTDVTSRALGAINADSYAVLESAANGVSGPQTASDTTVLDVIEYHEGYSLSVYPDGTGLPTVGIGLNLADVHGATRALAAAGLNYSTVYKTWTNTKALWASWCAANKPKSRSLNDGNPSWYTFLDQTPAARTAVMTDAQARTVLQSSVNDHQDDVASFIGPQFYQLDRDPQIALIDLDFNVKNIRQYTHLKDEVVGYDVDGEQNATDYNDAAGQLTIKQAAGSTGAANRQSDDQALMRDGQYPSTFTISPESIAVGDTDSLDVTSEGAKGKGIVLDDSNVSFTAASNAVATVDDSGDVTGVSQGTTVVTETLSNAAGLFATGDITVGEEAGTYLIPPDGTAVPLTGARPGDTVTVQVDYTTTDENENGEGEYLTLSSQGGFSANDASYNATTVYAFTVTLADESVTATPIGWDGDEGAQVTARVGSATGGNFTPKQQAALSQSANGVNTAAAGSGAIATSVAGTVGADDLLAAAAVTADATTAGSTAAQGLANAVWVNTALLGLTADALSQQLVDSTDTGYTSIARPALPSGAVLSHPADFEGLKNAGALSATIDALDRNREQTVNVADAAAITAHRLDGATAAKNKKWIARQRASLASYKRQEAALLSAEPVLAGHEATQLTKGGFGTLTVSPEDVESFEEGLADGSPPAPLTAALTKLGVNSGTQSRVQQALFAQDIDDASGTYNAILTSTTLRTDFAALVALLRTR